MSNYGVQRVVSCCIADGIDEKSMSELVVGRINDLSLFSICNPIKTTLIIYTH